MKNFKSFSVYILSVILVVFDQFVKNVVVNNLEKISNINIFGILKFTYCENTGVAFGLGSGNLAFFIIANIFILLAVGIFYELNKLKFKNYSKYLFSLILAGGLSNLLDRIFRGYVVDFIDINQIFNFAIFNIADIFICIGIIGLVLYYLKLQEFFRKES